MIAPSPDGTINIMNTIPKGKQKKKTSYRWVVVLPICLLTCAIAVISVSLFLLWSGRGGQRDDDIIQVTTETGETTTIALDAEFDRIVSVDAYKDRLAVFGQKGNAAKILYLSHDGALLDVITVEKPEGCPESLTHGCLGRDGTICFLFQSMHSGDNDTRAVLSFYDDSHSLIRSAEVTTDRKIEGILVTEPGDCYLWKSDEVIVLTDRGETRINVPLETAVIDLESDAVGIVYAIVYTAGYAGICLADVEDATMSEIVSFDYTILPGAAHHTNVSGTVYISTADGLFEYDTVNRVCVSRLPWMLSGFDGEYVSGIAEADENTFLCMLPDDTNVYLIHTKTVETKRVRIRVAAIRDANPRLQRYVSFFNGQSDRYYAEIVYYDDPDKLPPDIAAGNVVDVVEVSGVSLPLTPDKFMNIEPLLKQINPQQLDDIYSSVLASLRMDGVLTSLCSSVWIKTVAGRTAQVGEMTGWSLNDAKTLEDAYEDGDLFPCWLTNEEMMLWMCNIGLAQFIDYDTMTCSFSSGGFDRVLEFCNSRPEELDMTGYISDYDPSVLLTVQLIQSEDWTETMRINYGQDDYTYVGFPNDAKENGHFFSRAENDVMFAIPANATHQDGAAEFVCGILDEKWQNQVPGISVTRQTSMDRLTRINEARPDSIRESDITSFFELMDQTNVFIHFDSKITEIIMEESQAYFSGAKTAEEVARIIDSRVGIYLSEMR